MTKRCSGCGATKALEDFSRSAQGAMGRQNYCKMCAADKQRKWASANRTRLSAKRALRYQRERKGSIAAAAAWNRANPERHAQLTREWAQRHPDRALAISRRKRARKRGAVGADYTTAAKIVDRVSMYGGKCYYCGEGATSVDHRIPLARGGSHLPANLVPACQSCNSKKYVRTEREWVAA